MLQWGQGSGMPLRLWDHQGRALLEWLMLERAWGRASAKPRAPPGSDARAQHWGPGAMAALWSQSAPVLSPPGLSGTVHPMVQGWGHPCLCGVLHVTSVR